MDWLIEFFGGKIALGLGKAGLMTLINGLIFTIKIAIVTSYITISLFLFNKFYDLLSDINNLVSTPSDSVIAWSLQVVVSMGIWNAFVDSFSLFSPIIVSISIIFLSKKALTTLNTVHQWAEDVTRINYI
jgi:glucose-6-phosphate-specific signal transduction histidine kinase